MGREENHIQRYALDRLALLERQGKVYAFRANSFSGRLKRWNGSEGVINNGKPGCPDIIACFKKVRIRAGLPVVTRNDLYESIGQFVGIELKSIAGKQSKEQKAAQALIESLGGEYWLIRTPEELEDKLRSVL